jgi:type IV pilus assembly protein PilM
MEIFPKALGSRPRLAVELRPDGVVAARAEDATAVLKAVAASPLDHTALAVGLKPGNLLDRNLVVAALRGALDKVSTRAGDRGQPVTLIVPDATARVLLLEFDALPAKPAEAIGVIRFRLKKLLPFDVDHAALSYQVMSTGKSGLRVLAVAMPREILEEYEGAVVAAGYTPGAVLTSTLAALACLEEQAAPVLVVNAGREGITTAIVQAGVLLLHRFLELADELPVLPEQDVPFRMQDTQSGDARISVEAAIQQQVLASAEAAMAGREIAQAVSVAIAYFEDTLANPPEKILSTGTLRAETLQSILEENGFGGADVREVVGSEALAAGVGTTQIPRSWLAGVRGALRN